MRAILVVLLLAGTAFAADPLTLDDAIRMAKARHPIVQASRAQVEAQRARVEQTRAGFIPGLTGSFSYVPQTANFVLTPGFQKVFAQRSTSRTVIDTMGNPVDVVCANAAECIGSTTATPRLVSYDLFNFWSMGVGLTWNVFDWGRTYYAHRAAGTNAEAQKLGLDAATSQVVLDVKLAFYAALAADASVTVAEEALAAQRKHVDQARAFHQVGSRTKIDVVSAESEVANAELTLARAHGGRDGARAQLAAALGDDDWKPYTLVPPPEAPDAPALALPGTEDALFAEAIAARPEPKELQLRARGFGDTAKSLRGAYLPQLTLALGPTFAGTDIGSLTTNFTISASLAYPITGMNPFLVHGQVREARANRAVAEAQERQVRNAVRLEAANARAQLVSAREAVQAARKLVVAARERRALADGRYQAGVGSILELSDAEFVWVNARFQEVRALLDVATARARLERVLGRF